MLDALPVLLTKLALALAVFLLVAYVGTVSKRIAGVLFTFPILNGIAIVTSSDPVRVADAIYPLVIFNCVLFALLMSLPQALPPAAWPRNIRLLGRVATWSVAWFAGAYLLTRFDAHVAGGGVLFAGATLIALAFMLMFWSGQPADAAKPRHHAADFVSFWGSAAGGWRIMLFVLAYACLHLVARAALDAKWVGMASALPLPGLFALATLIDETGSRPRALHPLRDTVFLGPLLVIPFNWSCAHALVAALPPDALLARYLLLLAFWSVAAFAVVLIIPRLAAYFDSR
jgi:hypothetical protein